MSNKQQALYPLLFEWENVARPWGGTHLGSSANGLPIGERWLLSTLPEHESVVKNGALKGQNLQQVIEAYPTELLGKKTQRYTLPLVKWIDTRLPLSIQVHPDDIFAQKLGLSNGKSELWYILDAVDNASVYAGFREALNAEVLRNCIDDETICDQLVSYRAEAGDCYFVPAGLVHAIGGGIQLLEIQQPSDTTYRLYDWGRTDAQGNKRELHLDFGVAAAHLALRATLNKVDPTLRDKQVLVNSSPLYLARHILGAESPLIIESKNEFRTYLSTSATFRLTWHSGNNVSSMTVAPMEVVLVPACIDIYTLMASEDGEVAVLEFAIC